jgi:hypothetical protein
MAPEALKLSQQMENASSFVEHSFNMTGQIGAAHAKLAAIQGSQT